LTLVGRIWADVNQILIPDFPPPYTISTKNLHVPRAYRKKMNLIGPILPVSSSDLPDKKELRKKLGLEESKPVIFAPISGPAKERAYFTGVLRQIFSRFPDDYQIVMSLGYPNSSVEPVANGNVVIRGWIPNRFEYLKACDVVVSRGGHGTLSQSICYGKPIILVPTPNHTEQFNNCKKAAELGVAEIIQQEDLTVDSLLAAVQKVLEKRFQQRTEQLQKEISKWNGLEIATKIIAEAA
jgi:UDP-N-acetylglucosamine--N-acetylmuramyl-(pentapeptide) pyrophosphoryl-undecaprenol N-acetylglucosamine transferase